MNRAELTDESLVTAGDDSREVTDRPLLPPLDVDDDELRRGVAAILFVADEPLTAEVIAETLGVVSSRVGEAISRIVEELDGDRIGFEVRDVAGGWRMMTAPSSRPVLERWLIGARHGRLTQAALETLAVVAYRQPIARATIGEIRGVNPDGALRSLVSRGLVTEVGREEGPGQAVLFGTTPQFLERMGLHSLQDLPPVPPFLPDGPAPDEPEAGGIAELRRRLRDGSERLGGPAAALRDPGGHFSGAGSMTDSEDDDSMAPPTPRARQADGQIGALSDRLEVAARNAMGRLRVVRAEHGTKDEAGVTEESDMEAPSGRVSPDPKRESDA